MTRPRAFTLLELLLATVLSTVLMIGVMMVIADLGSRGISDVRRAGSVSAGGDSSIEALLSLLREDLAQAASVDQVSADSLVLTGYVALDSSRREQTHRPAQVVYRFEEIDGKRWLIRRQALLDVLSNENVQRDLVCCGLTRFELTGVADAPAVPEVAPTRAQEGQTTKKKSDGGKSAGPEGGLAPTPEQTQETVFWMGNNWYVDCLPQWAREELFEGRLTRRMSDGTGKTGDESTDEVPTDEVDRVRMGGIVWRLREWTDDSVEPMYDRIVTIRHGGVQ